MSEWFIDKRNGFLAYKPTRGDLDAMYAEHTRDFKNTNILNHRTVYDKEESRMAGILGEIVFQHYLGETGVRCKNLSYDYVFNGKKIDVKCKFRTVVPRPIFEASFFSYQADTYYKDVEYYAFLSTIRDYETVWFCAYSSKENWLHNPNGVLWKTGQIDPTNRKRFDKDTWSVFYKDLGQFTDNPYNCFV